MNKGKRRVPKLRFPGFTEDWEQRKFGELFILKSGVAFKLSEYTKNGIPIINGESIKAGKISLEKVNYLPNEYQYKYQECLLFPGDIVLGLNRPIIDGELKISRIPSDIKTSLLYQRAGKIIFKVNMEENFTYQLLSKEVLTFTRREAVGSDQPFITTTKLNKWDLCLPVKDEERRMIGNLLDNINNIITLHQRKLEHLNLKKKTLLQKLFPKNGERYPELRFPGFTDAWEQRKLGEIFEYLQNNTLSRDSLNYKNPNIKNIHYGDILVKFDEILDGSNKDIPYINSELDLSKFSKSLLRDGDIVFSDTAEDDAVGKAIELQNVSAPFILSGLHTIPCRPLIPFGKGYLGNFLNSDSYRMQLRPLVQGIKVSSISKSALKDTIIVYPKKLDEQEKIGGLFYHISKMITLHQRKLEHLQLHKKALLQQMFV